LVAWGVPASPPSEPAVVFLDVGQGDAILIRRPPDVVILVDGGRDVAVLEGALRRHGVGEIDVLAVTHGDADHAGGLQGVVERHRVGEIWYPEGQDHGELIESLLVEAAAGGVPVAAVGAGDAVDFGSLRLELLAPRRRYAAENDGSIVTWVTAGGIDVLLTGDVEAVAQAELPTVRPDVLQVPHHGSATTDLDWLAETVGSVAVISVGENTYGHPTPGVLDVLASAGSTVLTTLGEGDVVVPLCPCPSPP
jgi:competence protein ComEC